MDGPTHLECVLLQLKNLRWASSSRAGRRAGWSRSSLRLCRRLSNSNKGSVRGWQNLASGRQEIPVWLPRSLRRPAREHGEARASKP